MSASSFIARPAGLPAWALGAVAIVLGAGLLLAFLQVLQAGVAQGASRRQSVADGEAARWQCDRMPGHQARVECRARLLADASSSSPAP